MLFSHTLALVFKPHCVIHQISWRTIDEKGEQREKAQEDKERKKDREETKAEKSKTKTVTFHGREHSRTLRNRLLYAWFHPDFASTPLQQVWIVPQTNKQATNKQINKTTPPKKKQNPTNKQTLTLEKERKDDPISTTIVIMPLFLSFFIAEKCRQKETAKPGISFST